jgi:hypothetical protein
MRHTFNVDPASRDVRCYQHTIISLSEPVEGLQPLGLRKITVKRCRIESQFGEPLANLLGCVLHLGEHHD